MKIITQTVYSTSNFSKSKAKSIEDLVAHFNCGNIHSMKFYVQGKQNNVDFSKPIKKLSITIAIRDIK
jgi:hypothetical protein